MSLCNYKAMHSEFLSRVPIGSSLYYTPELPLVNVHALVLKALDLLQNMSAAQQTATVVDDWLDHDGLEFPRGTYPFAYLYALAATPRSLFDGTPKDHAVFLRAEAPDRSWILRIRTEWDDADHNQIGEVQLVVVDSVSSEVQAAFESEMNRCDLIRYAR